MSSLSARFGPIIKEEGILSELWLENVFCQAVAHHNVLEGVFLQSCDTVAMLTDRGMVTCYRP